MCRINTENYPLEPESIITVQVQYMRSFIQMTLLITPLALTFFIAGVVAERSFILSVVKQSTEANYIYTYNMKNTIEDVKETRHKVHQSCIYLHYWGMCGIESVSQCRITKQQSTHSWQCMKDLAPTDALKALHRLAHTHAAVKDGAASEVRLHHLQPSLGRDWLHIHGWRRPTTWPQYR